MQTLWWPTTVTAKPKTSRQNRKPHGKNKNLTANPKTSQQKQNMSRKNQNPHSKTKDLMAKPNTSQQKWNTPRQKQTPMAKPKLFCSCSEVFGFDVRYFVFAVRYFGFAVRFLVLLWCFCFCHEVFRFAMTVVGHRKKLQTRQLYRLTVNTSAYLARRQTSTHPPYTPTHFYQ